MRRKNQLSSSSFLSFLLLLDDDDDVVVSPCCCCCCRVVAGAQRVRWRDDDRKLGAPTTARAKARMACLFDEMEQEVCRLSTSGFENAVDYISIINSEEKDPRTNSLTKAWWMRPKIVMTSGDWQTIVYLRTCDQMSKQLTVRNVSERYCSDSYLTPRSKHIAIWYHWFCSHLGIKDGNGIVINGVALALNKADFHTRSCTRALSTKPSSCIWLVVQHIITLKWGQVSHYANCSICTPLSHICIHPT